MQTEILKSWLESECNEELLKVCTWLSVNKLTLNALKSNCHLSSRPKSSNFPFSVNIRITDSNSNTSQPLEIKTYIKYIGVLIDSNPIMEISCRLYPSKSQWINRYYCQAPTFCFPSCTSHLIPLFNSSLSELWHLCLRSGCWNTPS